MILSSLDLDSKLYVILVCCNTLHRAHEVREDNTVEQIVYLCNINEFNLI